MPEVSAVVVSWNTRDLLRECLESWRGEVAAGRAEVVVVDNASDDGSAEMVEAEFPEVELVASPENLGFGRAVNLGAARARGGAWLAIVNADTRIGERSVDALLAAGARDPGAGVLAPRLVLPDGHVQHSVLPFPTVRFTVAFNLGRARDLLPSRPLAPEERRVPWALAAFLLVRREAWDAVGGFDAAQWMYAEDLDLGWRLHEAGWATRYVPSATVHHHSGASAEQAFGAGIVLRQQRSTYAWMLRRRGAPRTRAVAAVNLAGAAARLAVAPRARRPELRTWVRAHAQGLEPARRLARHR